MSEYFFPEGFSGKGSDIKWCFRAHGGKRCLFCKHYAEFKVWSSEYRWYYLYHWYDTEWKWDSAERDPRDATCIIRKYKSYFRKRTGLSKWTTATEPPRYRTPGLVESGIKSLLRKGCNDKRKCKCVKVIQRANWYCPECWVILEKMSKHKGEHIHNLMINPLEELKTEALILRLSGSL